MKDRVVVMHGVNFDVLERRPADLYSGLTLSQLEIQIEQFARAEALEPTFFQTNHEGEFIEELHRVSDYADGLIINPGAWTHYAWAIRDALELTGLPAVEVHLSDLTAREDFRKISVIGDICVATVMGRGVDGYKEGLERLKQAFG